MLWIQIFCVDLNINQKQKDMKTKNLQRGSASVTIDLRGGFIQVNHGSTGEVLIKRQCLDGEWNKLFEQLRSEFK